MVIIELAYKKAMDEVEKFLEPHRVFLRKYYDIGIFMMSGPKIPRDGGIIIENIDKLSIEDIIKEDPFYLQGIADYTITEFAPNLCGEELGV